MRNRILALTILAACAAVPAFAQGTVPAATTTQAQATPTAPATPTTTAPLPVPPATTASLPKPPVPPGTPVPANAPAIPVLPPLTVDLTKPLTVDDALTVAFERNPDLRIAVDVARRAVGVVAEARANFNPRFNGNVTYLRQPGSTATFPAAPGQPAQSVRIQNPQAITVAVTGTLPLDISHRLAYTTDIARYQFDIQYLSLVGTSERLIQNVKVTYYDLLRAYGQARVAQAAVDVANVRLANTQARFEAGTVPKFDVTTAQVDLANLNQQLIQAQTRVETARSLFNRALGIDINNPTQVVDMTPQVSLAPIDIPADIQAAQVRRPEIRASKAAIALNQRNVKLQQTGLRPSASINLNTGFNVETTAFNNQNVNWSATALVNLPIWDGGITKARVEQARADVVNAADTLDQTALQIGVDVRNSALSVEEAARRTQTTAGAVSLAEEALRLANVRYEAGIAVLVEVTNAESQLTQARFNYINAQYDYAAAVAALERATSSQPELDRVQLLNAQCLRG